MKKLLCLALAVLLALAVFGCAKKPSAEGDWKYITDKGTLVIGITLYPPMNYRDDNGNLVGFDTEFAELVCEKLGVEPEFIVIDWDTKEIELNNKNIDCIWNGFTISAEREENLDFSTPYLNNKQVTVIRKADADKYTDLASLAAARLVAEVSSAGESAIKDSDELAGANYTAVDKQTTAMMEVKAGTADAAVLDYTLATSMTADGTDYSDLMIISDLVLIDEQYGIGFRTDSNAVGVFNEAMEELAKDGSILAIAEKYQLENALLIK